METRILQGIEGAKKAEGLTVVIDVFRAFTTACCVMSGYPQRIIPVADIERARQLKKDHPDWILMGERDGQKPEDFDYGNSPSGIEYELFFGQNVILTTSSGTQGIEAARITVSEIITGALVNVSAIVRYIQEKNPQVLSLVSLGTKGREPADEDNLCAVCIQAGLWEIYPTNDQIRGILEKSETAQKFFDFHQPWFSRDDFDLCVSVDQFHGFVLRLNTSEELPFLERVSV